MVLTAPLSFNHFCTAVCGPFFLQSSIFRRLRKTDSYRNGETKAERTRQREGALRQSNWKHISDTCLLLDSHSTEAFKMWVFSRPTAPELNHSCFLISIEHSTQLALHQGGWPLWASLLISDCTESELFLFLIIKELVPYAPLSSHKCIDWYPKASLSSPMQT